MADISEDRDRQVVPRWRSFVAAGEYGELTSLKRVPRGNISTSPLDDVLEDWRREPGLSVAADVVSTAVVIGCTEPAREAARYLIDAPNAPPVARDIAMRCIESGDMGPNPEFKVLYGQVRAEDLNSTIQRTRQRLSENPVNPILWTNLALHFTTVGESAKALRAIQVALGLAGNNRFVVRAACRFFLHQGDPERSHDVLHRAESLTHDPWILAGELAVASVRRKTSRFVKKARTILASQNYSPFDLSEMAGALATMEAANGGIRQAKKLGQLALIDPSENAIAQIAWLNRRFGAITLAQSVTTSRSSSEANAWNAREVGDWNGAFSAGINWQRDQPFSSRPAIFAGHVASTILEEFGQAESVLKQGMISNRNEAILCNNLAFVLAKQGKVAEASVFLKRGKSLSPSTVERICLEPIRELNRGSASIRSAC